MALPGISFGGLASGLDTQAIISALVSLEARPIRFLEAQRAEAQNRSKAFDALLDRLQTLQDQVETLASAKDFVARRVSLSEEGYFTASTTSDAALGEYSVNVQQLARAELDRSDTGYDDQDTTTFGIGTISIDVGGEVTDITIEPGAGNGGPNLLGLRDAINASDAEVTASVVFDGTQYWLEVRGNETGAANTVTVDTSGLSGGDATINLSTVTDYDAQDAVVLVDSLRVTSSNNTIEGAIEGVTLQLQAAQDDTGADPVTLSISEDFEEIEARFQDLVTAYNAVVRFVNDQFTHDPTNEDVPAPPLFGDTTLRMMRRQMGMIVASAFTGENDRAYDSLGTIGLHLENDGTLRLDSEELQEALASDLEGVMELLTTPPDDQNMGPVGIFVQMQFALEQRTDSIDGFIKVRKDGIQETVKRLDAQILRAEYRLEGFESGLVRKFAAFETLIGQLQSQGSALGAIFLNNNNSS